MPREKPKDPASSPPPEPAPAPPRVSTITPIPDPVAGADRPIAPAAEPTTPHRLKAHASYTGPRNPDGTVNLTAAQRRAWADLIET
jgi:hypothetical protein